jgi:hypothetical protein
MQTDYPQYFSCTHTWNSDLKKKWWSKSGVWLTTVVCLDNCYNDFHHSSSKLEQQTHSAAEPIVPYSEYN